MKELPFYYISFEYFGYYFLNYIVWDLWHIVSSIIVVNLYPMEIVYHRKRIISSFLNLAIMIIPNKSSTDFDRSNEAVGNRSIDGNCVNTNFRDKAKTDFSNGLKNHQNNPSDIILFLELLLDVTRFRSSTKSIFYVHFFLTRGFYGIWWLGFQTRYCPNCDIICLFESIRKCCDYLNIPTALEGEGGPFMNTNYSIFSLPMAFKITKLCGNNFLARFFSECFFIAYLPRSEARVTQNPIKLRGSPLVTSATLSCPLLGQYLVYITPEFKNTIYKGDILGQLGELQHFNTTPLGEMQHGEMQFGEMQLSRIYLPGGVEPGALCMTVRELTTRIEPGSTWHNLLII
ncbi:hypothetical protein H8356DRAFT_1361565 [Neocallimastix lanati (nom. inval.)]|nr:hypothetical protein H8356DRAFT_1361565 [Neocallimastix sp. JGI-2020a]